LTKLKTLLEDTIVSKSTGTYKKEYYHLQYTRYYLKDSILHNID